MLKRGVRLLGLLLILSILDSSIIFAQEEGNEEIIINEDEVSSEDLINDVQLELVNKEESFFEDSEFRDAELEVSGGITPDSAFYFIDEFFDRFGNDLDIREEKIAEIKIMVEAGKIDDARIALENYLSKAENLEREIDPEKRDDALRSASAIHNTLIEIEDKIPEEDREDFVDNVIEIEEGIATAAEIASKVKELCQALAELDPEEYYKTCKTDEESPNWQKKLHKRLTKEQEEEARKFGKIMRECFRTSGQTCKCEEIPFPEFANTCSIAAPLATACDIEGDEVACEKLDNLEMPQLPDHLQEIMNELEGGIKEEMFDMHMPFECKEAGAKTPRECGKIMISLHAPEECREALINAEVENEREAREICDKIMFEANAPQECIDEGARDPKECSKIMFQINAPQECIDAGLTGENRKDPKDCEKIMRELMGSEGERRHGPPRMDCSRIQDSQERLKCYDTAITGFNDFKENHREEFNDRFRETQELQRKCAEMCSQQGQAWSFFEGSCECHVSNFEDRRSEPSDGGIFIQPEGDINTLEPRQIITEPITSTTEPQPIESSTEQAPTTEPQPVTEAIITGNAFLDYFFI